MIISSGILGSAVIIVPGGSKHDDSHAVNRIHNILLSRTEAWPTPGTTDYVCTIIGSPLYTTIAVGDVLGIVIVTGCFYTNKADIITN
jgi:hypothetical protein